MFCCVSTAAMVKRKRYNVALYVQYIASLVINSCEIPSPNIHKDSLVRDVRTLYSYGLNKKSDIFRSHKIVNLWR
jgi:hypothetical protein